MSVNNLLTYELQQTAQEVQEALSKLVGNEQAAGKILITDGLGKVVFQPQVGAGNGLKLNSETQLLSLSDDVQNILKNITNQNSSTELNTNKVTSFSDNVLNSPLFGNDTYYPSAKLVYNTFKGFGVQVANEYTLSDIKAKFEAAGYASNVLYVTHLSGSLNGPCCFMQTGDINSENAVIQLVMFYNHNWKWVEGSVQSGKVRISKEQDYDFDNITGANSNIGSIDNLHADIRTDIGANKNVVAAINAVYSRMLAYGAVIGDISPQNVTSALGTDETIISLLGKLRSVKAPTKLSQLQDDLGTLDATKGHKHSQYIAMPSVTNGGDKYLYLDSDGKTIRWNYVTEGGATFSDLGGNPYDNSALTSELNKKQNTLTAGSGINIVDNIISADLTPKFQNVSVLPTPSRTTQGYIYLVPNAYSTVNDTKDEYITVKTTVGDSTTYSWEKIGNTSISLDGYATENFVTQNYVPRTFTINSKALAGTGISLTLSDILASGNEKLLKEIKVNGNTYTKSYDSESLDLGNYQTPITADTELTVKKVTANKFDGSIRYLTTAPTADNTSGCLDIVILSAEPETKYNGYLYIVTAQ